jgi:hypothetical protein
MSFYRDITKGSLKGWDYPEEKLLKIEYAV